MVDKVKQYFKNLSIDDEDYHRLMKDLKELCDTDSKKQKMFILTGEGSNGKSMFTSLLSKLFGDQTTKLPTNIFHKSYKPYGNKPTPELANLQGKKFAFMDFDEYLYKQESKINVGRMKELIGGDTIYARALYKNPVVFKPEFKLIMTTNRVPDIFEEDKALRRRLKIIPFKSQFINNDDDQDLIDEIYENHIEEFGQFIRDYDEDIEEIEEIEEDEPIDENDVLKSNNGYVLQITI